MHETWDDCRACRRDAAARTNAGSSRAAEPRWIHNPCMKERDPTLVGSITHSRTQSRHTQAGAEHDADQADERYADRCPKRLEACGYAGDASSELSRRVERAIRRGLSPSPDDRWASMDALLNALDPALSRRRSRVAGIVVIAIALMLALTAAVLQALMYREWMGRAR